MSLDFAILDETGKPKASIPLSAEEHWAILQQAKQLALPLWNRMSDYYADADYGADEVLALADETAHLTKVCSDSGMLVKLKEIEAMLRAATEGKNTASAIAD